MYERVVVREGSREFTLLVDAAGAPKFSVEEMTGKLDAPKAALMGVLVDGVLTQKLPWSLILIGAVISIMLEIIGVAALPVAVGIYLPISTSATIFAGGLIRALVGRLRGGERQETLAEEETGKGVLLSSGLIAGGSIGGLLVAAGRVALGGEQQPQQEAKGGRLPCKFADRCPRLRSTCSTDFAHCGQGDTARRSGLGNAINGNSEEVDAKGLDAEIASQNNTLQKLEAGGTTLGCEGSRDAEQPCRQTLAQPHYPIHTFTFTFGNCCRNGSGSVALQG